MNTLNKLGGSSKFIVSALGTLAIGLQTAYPGDKWSNLVTSGIASVLVWFVANTKSTPPSA